MPRLCRRRRRGNRTHREGLAGRSGDRRQRFVVPRRPGNSGGGKGPQFTPRQRVVRMPMEVGKPTNSSWCSEAAAGAPRRWRGACPERMGQSARPVRPAGCGNVSGWPPRHRQTLGADQARPRLSSRLTSILYRYLPFAARKSRTFPTARRMGEIDPQCGAPSPVNWPKCFVDSD